MSKVRIFICSSIKGLRNEIEIKLTAKLTEIMETSAEELIKNPINDKNAFLVADNPFMTGILQNPEFDFGFIQGTWAGIDSLAKSVDLNREFKIPLCRFGHPSFSQLVSDLFGYNLFVLNGISF